ncbi:hypothetical protein KKF82_05410, partial [Patescibacteria group bacterium]|nr:hypothetical protein [Patescibacteria group bacterium]
YVFGAVGCLMKQKDLIIEEKTSVKGCSHDFNRTDFTFCPYCGAIESKVALERTTTFEDHFVDNLNDDLAITFTIHPIYDTDYVVVSIAATSMVDLSCSATPYTVIPFDEDYKLKAKSILEPVGLWNEDAFGFYAVGNVSY